MTSPKSVVRACLMAIALVLFVLHVHGVVEKYFDRRTNFSTKETRPVALKFPAFSFCPSQAFQKDKIKLYNISSKFMHPINTNNQQLYNKSVWDVFQDVSYVLNRDFNITFSQDDQYFTYLKVGANNVTDENQKLESYTVIVYELHTTVMGTCYSIAPQINVSFQSKNLHTGCPITFGSVRIG
jgi:hypothetical protein